MRGVPDPTQNEETNGVALTSSSYWDEQWRGIELPYLVDPAAYWWSTFIRLFERVLSTLPGTVLEVGCGASEWLVYFERRYGARSFGIDYSSVACEIGARNLELAGCSSRIVRADVRALPFRPASFDLVFSAGVVEHFERYADLIHTMGGLVRPGGQLLTTVPNFAGWVGVARSRQDPATASMHLRIHEDDLRAIYAAAGLHDVDVGHFGSFRVPYQTLPRVTGLGSALRAAAATTGRVIDRALVTGYRLTGRSIESEWLSNGLYAVGRRAAATAPDGGSPSNPS
jgi:SAM-dependent methyltransferase